MLTFVRARRPEWVGRLCTLLSTDFTTHFMRDALLNVDLRPSSADKISPNGQERAQGRVEFLHAGEGFYEGKVIQWA